MSLPETLNGSAQLNREISEAGRNLSVGERQLVCLARALVEKNNNFSVGEKQHLTWTVRKYRQRDLSLAPSNGRII